ncbi:hypothetical protein QQF64_033790, partial [Cirrhinus molitorella]
PAMAVETRKESDLHAWATGLSEENGLNKESGGQTNGGSRMEYLNKATVVIDPVGYKEIKGEDIIKDVTEK